jgi:hypothetical protein
MNQLNELNRLNKLNGIPGERLGHLFNHLKILTHLTVSL